MGHTLLEAVKSGDIDRLAEMLRNNPSLVNERDPTGPSPLMTALYYGKSGVVKLLLDRGAIPNAHESAAMGDVVRLRAALDADESSLNSYSPDGWTPLHLAAHFGHAEAVRFLLERGADPAKRSTNSLDNQPLHAALAGYDPDSVLPLLLDAGAPINEPSAEGYTALHLAAMNGQTELVRLLLARGADPSIKTADGKTAGTLAGDNGHAESAALLTA